MAIVTPERHDWLLQASPLHRDRLSDWMSQSERDEFAFNWNFFGRDAQLAPQGDWRVWLLMAGRGFGKTRAGAEWVRQVADGNPAARIALVSSSLAEARSVMVEGESGILACCPPERRPVFESSLRRLRFPNGAQAMLYSAAEPESLRGPQHSHARRPGPERILCKRSTFPARSACARIGRGHRGRAPRRPARQ
jgi:phage terminase large subunit-like protein